MSSNDDAEDRRQRLDEAAIPASDRLPPDVEAKLLSVAGFTRAELYDRRGAIPDRGLAGMLNPGDQIQAVHSDHVEILRPGGIVQSFWNLRKAPAWAKALAPVEEDGA